MAVMRRCSCEYRAFSPDCNAAASGTDELRGCRGCGSAPVGYEIGNGKINLVPDAADHGDNGTVDSPGNDFLVE